MDIEFYRKKLLQLERKGIGHEDYEYRLCFINILHIILNFKAKPKEVVKNLKDGIPRSFFFKNKFGIKMPDPNPCNNDLAISISYEKELECFYFCIYRFPSTIAKQIDKNLPKEIPFAYETPINPFGHEIECQSCGYIVYRLKIDGEYCISCSNQRCSTK